MAVGVIAFIGFLVAGAATLYKSRAKKDAAVKEVNNGDKFIKE